MNAPDRYERFVVPEGTKKVSYERDTRIINAASFTIKREDHAIGNILRMQLHRDDNVLFAGYKWPILFNTRSLSGFTLLASLRLLRHIIKLSTISIRSLIS